jgi:DivIVA domain-containing protein
MAADARAEFDPKEIARAAFPTAFRGYDQDAVRRYLSRLANAIGRAQAMGRLGAVDSDGPNHAREAELELEITELRARIAELEDELRDQALLEQAAEASLADRDLNEAELIELLGQETARVLEQARSAGADIVHRAEGEAGTITERAELQARTTLEAAESTLASAQAEAEQTRAAATAEADRARVRADAELTRARDLARAKADEILAEAARRAEQELTEAQGRANVTAADAERLREEVLGDLVRRRRVYQQQLDRMSSARDRLGQALAMARSELETVTVEIDLAASAASEVDVTDRAPNRIDLDAAAEAEVEIEVAELVAGLDVPSSKVSQRSRLEPGAFVDGLLGSATTGAAERSAAESGGGSPGGLEAGTNQAVPSGDELGDGVVVLDEDDDLGDEDETGANDVVLDDRGVAGDGFDRLGGAEAGGSEAPVDDSETDGGRGAEGADDQIGTATTVDDLLGPADGDGLRDEAVARFESAAVESARFESAEAGPDPLDPAEADPGGGGPGSDVLAAVAAATATGAGWEPVEGDLVEGARDVSVRLESDAGDHGGLAGEGVAEEVDAGESVSATGAPENLAFPRDHSIDEPNGVLMVSDPDLPRGPLDFGGRPPLRTGAGTSSRVARGDLPRSGPFGGTLPAAFERRDIALTRATPGFRRLLKRAVNDDQSLVLDGLRAGRGTIRVEELPEYDEQLDGYLVALQPVLTEVMKAGAEVLGHYDVDQDSIDTLCLQLGRHIVDCLRRPTIAAIEAAVDNDREAILDPVRATYRDFRNSLLPDLIDDALHEAFASGLFGAIDGERPVLWVTDPRLDPDPICEENSAAPPLLRGTRFPSGHLRPLSMPGCRCLAIPAP